MIVGRSSQGEKMTEQFAWLIELDHDKSGANVYFAGLTKVTQPRYGDYVHVVFPQWTYEHGEAIRFSRKQDAQQVALGITVPTRLIEHAWGTP